jgi:dTDP-4-dehydrorhamnose reductase
LISTVLITGGSGLLAVNWAVAVRNRYRVILGLHEREISMRGVEARRLDLSSVDDAARSIEPIGAAMVVHTIGLTSVERCEAEPGLAQYVNVDVAFNVAAACSKIGVPLVHISSDHLFSGRTSLVDEGHPVAPVNVYGRTKAGAESRVLDVHEGALVIRTNFYGWGPSYRSSFSDWIISGAREGRDLTLFDDVIYTPILIEPAVEAVHELWDLGARGVFNIVGDERLSKYDFGLRVAARFGLDRSRIKPGLLTERSSLVERPRDMSLSNQRACDYLGRSLGGVDEHLTRLQQQEDSGVAQLIQML